MALSNLNKDTLTRLFNMININNDNNIHEIKSNYSTYSKLELIAKQIKYLEDEALNILEEHNINNSLNDIKCNFKKVPGKYYYLYIINGEIKLSMISDDEWNTYEKFLGKFYYDYDYNFKKINN